MKNLTLRNNRNPDFFGDFFDDAFAPMFRPFFPEAKQDRLMKTDIKESENEYTLEVEVPGFKKEDIKIDLENGYLTISAKKEQKEEDEKEHYLRRERSFCGQRAFYVGDIKEEDVCAKYDGGVLIVSFPKDSHKEPVKKGITIA